MQSDERQQLGGLEARPPSKPTDSLRDRLVGDPELDSDRVIAPALDAQGRGYASKTRVQRGRDGVSKDLLRSRLGDRAQCLGRSMVVDPKQPSDPGDRDASVAKLKSLQRDGLINRRHNSVAKLNNQRQGGRGSRPLRSRPPIPLTECWTRHQSNSSQRQSERSQQPGSSSWHAGAEPQVRDQPRTRSERRQRNGNPIDRRSGAQTPPARSMVPARTCRDEREPMELAFLARDRAPRGQGMNSPRR